MRIAVTGTSGALGPDVVDALRPAGRDVLAVHREPLDGAAGVDVDLRDRDATLAAMAEPEGTR